MPRLPLLVLALGLAHVVGCAAAPPPAPTADAAPRRRRARRPRPAEEADTLGRQIAAQLKAQAGEDWLAAL